MLFTVGEVGGEVNLQKSGNYVFRAKAWGQQAGSEVCKMAFRIDDKPISVVEVAAEKGKAQLYEVPIKLSSGKHRIAVAFTNDFYDPKAKDAWPRSSFLGKPTPEEKTYLGDPSAELEGRVAGLDEHLAALRLGGGCARAAVTALAATKPAGALEGAVKVLKDEKASPYARAEAARLLGLLADASAAPALRKAVTGEARRDTSRLASTSARALVALKDAGGVDALSTATRTWAAWFEGKRQGPSMSFSDWERGLRTLSALVTAWADLGGEHAAEVLDKFVVARVFAGGPKVETSDRVPQDPSVARSELARAVAKAYAVSRAPDGAWDALLASLAGDANAKAAATEERK